MTTYFKADGTKSICKCGAPLNPKYDMCWTCKQEVLADKARAKMKKEEDKVMNRYFSTIEKIQSEEDYLRYDFTKFEDECYDGSDVKDISCSFGDYTKREHTQTVEDEIVTKQLAFLEYENNKAFIEKVINAFNNRKEFDTIRLVEALDKIKISDFKKYLIETNKKILSSNGVLHVATCKKEVTDRDCYETMLHIRDVARLSERTLRNSEFGTVTSYIAYLEKIESPNFDPEDRNDYNFMKDWDYGNDDDSEVTDEQLSDLIAHFTGVGESTRSAKKAAE